jgi:hypothetical protein
MNHPRKYLSKRQSIIYDLRNKYSHLAKDMSNRQVLVQLYPREKKRQQKKN